MALEGEIGLSGSTRYQELVAYVLGGCFFAVAVDLACGSGGLGSLIRGNVGYLIGVDHNEERLSRASRRGVYDELLLMDVREYVPPPSTEALFMLEVIEHLSKAEGIELLSRFDRVPTIVITTPEIFYSVSLKNGHASHWAFYELNQLGFETFIFRRNPFIELLYGRGLIALKAPTTLMNRFRAKLLNPYNGIT